MIRARIPLLLLIMSSPIGDALAQLPPEFVHEVVVGGLDQPVSMAFLPDGRMLITERISSKVRMRVGNHLAVTDPALTVANVSTNDLERGLQGIAVDPRWPAFPYLYVAFTRDDSRTALVRYTGSGDLSNPAGENVTFDSPLVLIDLTDVNTNHNGLGLRFMPSGHLLMSTGDDFEACTVENPSNLRGVLMRLDVSRLPPGPGGPVPKALLIPPDNPLSGPDSNARLVYAHGLRNPWRFHPDTTTGAVLVADVGDGLWEELDEVYPGDDLGWPYREGPLVRTWPGCTEPGGSGNGVYDPPAFPVSRLEGFYVIQTAGIYRPAPGGAANWPALYWNNIFYSEFFDGRMRRLTRSGPSWVAAAPVAGQPGPNDWGLGFLWATDFLRGPDGSLYWLRMQDALANPGSGSLNRVRYTGPTQTGVEPPTIAASGPTAVPNPSRGAVEFAWRRPSAAGVTLEILDVSGRRVRSLSRSAEGGEARWVWDGRDDRGLLVPSGLYLARFSEPAGASLVLRCVRLR